MKEARFFFVPDAAVNVDLPEEETQHAVKVLRLEQGDDVYLMDGKGCFYKAEITLVAKKRCQYAILQTLPQQKAWGGRIEIAIAPTKNIDRMEWMLEKCTEIGFDAMTFINSRFSERRQIRKDRLYKIMVSAAKQSRKPYFPVLNDMINFAEFVGRQREGRKFICHCYNEIEKADLFSQLNLCDKQESITVLVGPEGDFSIDEVQLAIKNGYESVTLGDFRLRTETAGMVAATFAQLAKRL
jgi:16S rRNA (uracil1498-N3)-methyltransferase